MSENEVETLISLFCCRQKDERKRNEDSVHRSHKHKADLYRKLQTNK